MLNHHELRLKKQLLTLPGYPLVVDREDNELVEKLVNIIRAQHSMLKTCSLVLSQLNACEIGFGKEFFSLRLDLQDLVSVE